MKYLQRKKMNWQDYLIGFVVFLGVAICATAVGIAFIIIMNRIG